MAGKEKKLRDSSTDERGVLYRLSGKGSEEPVKLRRDATIFGRDKGDVVVSDSEVSSTHCQIQNIDGSFHIFDMNSTNGTFVNSERIIKAKLRDEDIVTVGKTSFRFKVEKESEVRHISTIFKTKDSANRDSRASLVDTLIEGELSHTKEYSIILHVTYHDGKQEKIQLNQQVVFVGRASSFGRFEQDTEISRKHMMIKVNDTGEVFIEDQGSTNGIFLNGKRINGMHPVYEKDEVKVGLSRMYVRAEVC